MCREVGDRAGEAGALNGLGETLLATDRPGHARIQHTTALRLATQIGDPYQQARAHGGLAHAHQAVRDFGPARRHRQEALTLYAGLHAPDAGDIRRPGIG